MKNVFFTSDEHYGHQNIIKLCNRPFSSLDEMTEALIERHNSVVTNFTDRVYHAGDMFWRRFGVIAARTVMARLNGQHFYVKGNHEELIEESTSLRNDFQWIEARAHIIEPGGPRAGIVLDHYAGRVWNGSHHGSWQLYGHTHNELAEESYLLSCDVGVDSWNYYPVSIDQLSFKMEAKRPAFEARRAMFAQIKKDRDAALLTR
jgi:calcineurin-like phosphoesterase family protein